MQYRYISDTHVYIRYTCIFKKKNTQNNKTPVVRKKNILYIIITCFSLNVKVTLKHIFAMC